MFFIPISRWAIAPVFRLLDIRREPGLSNGTGRIKRGDAAHLPKELRPLKPIPVPLSRARNLLSCVDLLTLARESLRSQRLCVSNWL